MPLKLRPTGLGSGIDKDRPDYTVVYRRVGCRPHLRDTRRSRQSALVLVDDRQRSDDALERVATLEEAKAQFPNCERWAASGATVTAPERDHRR